MKKPKYKTWTLIDWDGNPSFNHKCYRKSFPRGHVSVGVGDFYSIVYSYGANSEDSYSSTRHLGYKILTEQEAMDIVDKKGGK
jgi:hypothetical protein